MSAAIDLSKKRNRIILALDIFSGTVFFGDCWPTEPMSSYFWRCGKTAWIKRVDLRGNDAAFESAASRNRGTTKLSEWTQ